MKTTHSPLDIELPAVDRDNRKGEAGHTFSYTEGVTITVLKQNRAYLVEVDAPEIDDAEDDLIDVDLGEIPKWYGAKEYTAVLDYAGQVLMSIPSRSTPRVVVAINKMRALTALESMTQEAVPLVLPYRQSRESIKLTVYEAVSGVTGMLPRSLLAD